MPVSAGSTALAPLDFADLVAKTPAFCATAGPFSVPRASATSLTLRGPMAIRAFRARFGKG